MSYKKSESILDITLAIRIFYRSYLCFSDSCVIMDY